MERQCCRQTQVVSNRPEEAVSRRLRWHALLLAQLVSLFLVIPGSMATAAGGEWRYITGAPLDEHAGTFVVMCLDTTRIQREGTVIRVWIGEGSSSNGLVCPSEFGFGQEEELIRCSDERIAVTEDLGGDRKSEPPPATAWKAARLEKADQKLVDVVCAMRSQLPDKGSAIYSPQKLSPSTVAPPTTYRLLCRERTPPDDETFDLVLDIDLLHKRVNRSPARIDEAEIEYPTPFGPQTCDLNRYTGQLLCASGMVGRCTSAPKRMF